MFPSFWDIAGASFFSQYPCLLSCQCSSMLGMIHFSQTSVPFPFSFFYDIWPITVSSAILLFLFLASLWKLRPPNTLYFPHAKISTVSMTLCAIDLESGKYYSIFERILLCFVGYMRNKKCLKIRAFSHMEAAVTHIHILFTGAI